MNKSLGILIIAALSGLLWAGCGGSDAGSDCVAGKACVCSGSMCDQTCGGDGKGCAFTCSNGATCSFSCPGGGCATNCSGAKSCIVDCPGNGCGLTCAGTATCEITACTGSCALYCGGATSCKNSCAALTGGCATVP